MLTDEQVLPLDTITIDI